MGLCSHFADGTRHKGRKPAPRSFPSPQPYSLERDTADARLGVVGAPHCFLHLRFWLHFSPEACPPDTAPPGQDQRAGASLASRLPAALLQASLYSAPPWPVVRVCPSQPGQVTTAGCTKSQERVDRAL